MNTRMISLTTLVVTVLVLTGSAWGITCEELEELLASDEKVTLIDVRSSETFQRGHIPNSLNVPAPLCGKKKLPALGRVIVVGGDLDMGSVRRAATALEKTPGIKTGVLEGGYARWEAVGLSTTRARGLTRTPEPLVSYDRLLRAAKSNPQLVLLDLRGNPESLARKAKRRAAPRRPGAKNDEGKNNDSKGATRDQRFKVYTTRVAEGETAITVVDDGHGRARQVLGHLGSPETEEQELDGVAVDRLISSQDDAARKRTIDLREHGEQVARMVDLGQRFRGVSCLDCSYLSVSPGALRERMTKSLLGSLDRNHEKVYVIIDDGLGSAAKFARHMRSAGIRRYYVLMGGEDALQREGVPERRTP